MSDASDKVARRIVPASDLTIYSVGQVGPELLAPLPEAGGIVEIDLRSVAEIDTAGLQLLIVAGRHVRDSGCTLRITHAQPEVRGTLEMLRIGALLERDV